MALEPVGWDNFQSHDVTFVSLHGNMTFSSSLSNQEPGNTVTIATFLHLATNQSYTPFSKHDPILQQYALFQVAYFLNSYYLWLVFAFGFPGNIVSFITVLRMKPFTSPTVYVAAVAFVDNTCLVCKVLFFSLTKFDVNIGHNGCAVLSFLGSFTAQFANWLLVAMTVERCLAICLPLKVGSICTRRLHVAGLVLIALILVASNSHHVITFEMVDNNGDLLCKTVDDFEHFLQVWFWVDAVVYAILPALLLILLNALIISGIRRSAIVQRELTSKASQVVETMRQQRQITVMLVIVCAAYVLLITPLAIFYAVKNHWAYKVNRSEYSKYLFTNQLAFLLADSTHAVNFYLYFFSTRRFRKRCLETIFYCCVPKRRSRRFRGSTISGTSKAFRMSVTDDTTVAHNAVQLAKFSSSSSSSSNHLLVANSDGNLARFKKSVTLA